MIDSTIETVISLADAAKELPRRRRGRRTHISCIYRWSTVGCRGVVLETLQVGGTRCTSREALQRFFERLSQPVQVRAVGENRPGVPTHRRSVPQRERQAAKAGRKLAAMGA